jgi:hypothetical protein
MIAVHSRYPAAHRVLLEESPRAADSRGMHDQFQTQCRKAYEAIVRADGPGSADVRIRGQVLAGALAGAVHEAAREGTLGSTVLRTELTGLVDSYLSRQQSSEGP